MIPDDENAQRESPSTRDSGRRGDSTFGEGTEPELETISRRSLDGAPKEFAIPDRFACQRWHRPYAEALIEKDPARRARLIVEARQEILQRYLELFQMPAPTEETRDLWNAAVALSEL